MQANYLFAISLVISMSWYITNARPKSPNPSRDAGLHKFRFRGVKVAGPFDVVINVNKTTGVRVKPGHPVNLSVDQNGILQVDLTSNKAIVDERFPVLIDNPEIDEIWSRKSSFIRVTGTVNGFLDVWSYDSSHIVADVFNDCFCNRNNLVINAYNSSVVDISGTVTSSVISAEGTSRVNGARLHGGSVLVSLRDSSQVEIATSSSVFGNVNNHAILRVKGHPSRKSVDKNDSGRVEYSN